VESRILAHVEEAEFVKEIARREAARILDTMSLAELADDPDGFVEELLAVVIASLRQRASDMARESRDYATALGLQRLTTEETQALLEEADDEFLIWAIPVITAAAVPVLEQISRMAGGAVASSTVTAALEAEATRAALLASFESTLKSTAATYIQELDRAVISVALEMTPEEEFVWLTVGDGNSCDDGFVNSCAPRHGEVRSLDEWNSAGRPGAPQLLCSIYAKGSGSYCRCQLAATSLSLPSAVDVAQSIRAGKDRAVTLYS